MPTARLSYKRVLPMPTAQLSYKRVLPMPKAQLRLHKTAVLVFMQSRCWNIIKLSEKIESSVMGLQRHFGISKV